MRVISEAFEEGTTIPEIYTCEGQDTSPPIAIEDVPERARSLALVVDDPDAPGGTFVHWLLWNLPPDTRAIPATVPTEDTVADLGAQVAQGENDFGALGYGGPCPPPGHGTHHYRFQVYALDARLELEPGASRAELEDAMEGHILAEAVLTGEYAR